MIPCIGGLITQTHSPVNDSTYNCVYVVKVGLWSIRNKKLATVGIWALRKSEHVSTIKFPNE